MAKKEELKKAIASAVKPVKKMEVSTWAEKYMVLPSTSAEPGKLKVSRTPYARAVMDAFTENGVKKVVVKSSAQIGKSTILLAVLGRFIHLDPCNIMIVLPTLEMAQDFSKDRISQLVKCSPVLEPLFMDLGKSRNLNQTILSKFFTGGRLVLVGSNSPAGLASRPIRLLLCDEVDRFTSDAGGEGDVISLAEKRQTSYWNAVTGIFSTPTNEGASRIDVEYNLGTQEEWQHACPNCGEYHFLDYRQMDTDYEEKIDEYKNRVVVVNSCEWKCPDCGYKFTQLEMRRTAQKYVMKNPEALKNGVRSYWINGFSSNWVDWRQIMQEYLESQGDALREQTVFNTRFGLSYELRGEFSDEKAFLDAREEYGAAIPEGIRLLTAGVDVQANRLECSIFGWGLGEECYGIRHAVMRGSPNEESTWRQLDEVINAEYKKASGGALKVARAFIDSGFATKNVYNYCRNSRVKFAVKGLGAIGIPLLHKYTKLTEQGIILTILGVNDGKQQIYSKLASRTMHFGRNDEYLIRNFDSIYFKQYTAEKLVYKRQAGQTVQVYEKVTDQARNEALDCAVYALAAMKSCSGESNQKAVAVKKTTLRQRQVDIWS